MKEFLTLGHDKRMAVQPLMEQLIEACKTQNRLLQTDWGRQYFSNQQRKNMIENNNQIIELGTAWLVERIDSVS